MGSNLTTGTVLTYDQLRSVSLRELPQSALVQAVTESPDLLSTAGRIETLLKHFFKERMSREDWDIILEDWIDTLSGLPYWAVEHACKEWMRTDRRKPTPHDIWKLASKEVFRFRDELNRRHDVAVEMAKPERVELSQEERQRREEFAASILKAQKFTGKKEGRAPTLPHWSDGLTVEEENNRMRELRKGYAV